MRIFRLVMLLLLWLPSKILAQESVRLSTIPGYGISGEVQYAFGVNVSRFGVLPIRVRLSNHSGAERSWRFSASSGNNYSGYTYYTHDIDTALVVANGQEKVFDFLLQLGFALPALSTYSKGVEVRLEGYGIGAPLPRYSNGYGVSDRTPTVGFSSALEAAWGVNMPKFDPTVSSPHFWPTAIRFDYLTPDWRAFSGFSAIWCTQDEWETGLGSAMHAALEDWVSAGGRIYVCDSSGPDSETSRSMGLGKITSLRGSACEAKRDADEYKEWTDSVTRHPQWEVDDHTSKNMTFFDLVDPPHGATGIVLLIGFIYALLVGPINILYLTNRETRYLLYLTTPILATLFISVLLLFIFLKDGFGGVGTRTALYVTNPTRPTAMIMQQEVARTGVLFRRAFALESPGLMYPIFSDKLSRQFRGHFEIENDAYAGEWFASRSRSAHYLQAVVPNRYRLNLARGTGKDLTINSSFPAVLRHVFYNSQVSGLWCAEGVSPGASVTMKPCPHYKFNVWQSDFKEKTAAVLKNKFGVLTERSGMIFADAAPTPEFHPMTTLGGIGWNNDLMIIAYPLEKEVRL